MMRNSILALAVLLGLFAVLANSAPAFVGSAVIKAPAVIISNNTGSLTNITLAVTKGNGTVSVVGPRLSHPRRCSQPEPPRSTHPITLITHSRATTSHTT